MAVHDAAGQGKRYSSDDNPKRKAKSNLNKDTRLLVGAVTQKIY
jgi:hypothetical protein